MENYRKTARSIYEIKYHIVWITKYRKPAITGQVAARTREIIRGVCQNNDVEILAEHVSKDHVHMLMSAPPHLLVGKLVQYMKGTTSRKLQMEYKEINKQFWGKHLWARGYFAVSSGNVTDEVIAEYIRIQDNVPYLAAPLSANTGVEGKHFPNVWKAFLCRLTLLLRGAGSRQVR